MQLKKLILLGSLFAVAGCRAGISVPNEFPTPEPAPWSTPLPKTVLVPDSELEKQIAEIAKDTKGKVGVAAVLLETGEAATLNADQRFPMQSVYKLPIAMAVMEQIKRGELDLDEKIGVTREDFVRAGMRSPLRDANPNGGEFTIRELIRLSLVESDGTASDVLLRFAGGATEIQSYLGLLGIQDMKVVNTEKEIGKDWQTQYDNWATPMASVELLRWLQSAHGTENDRFRDGGKPAAPTGGYMFIVASMATSLPGQKRLKGNLPKNSVVAHKTGTGGTQNGITGATNDVGIVTMPNGKHIAIAVFVSDSPADEMTREAVIARIAKACWDKWSKI
ncbi:MAG: class A beta-lactamase [Pyrinomonadaceae bacterium]|nr:class A beta-lactamase [Pyrinomonadaceae bacterium]